MSRSRLVRSGLLLSLAFGLAGCVSGPDSELVAVEESEAALSVLPGRLCGGPRDLPCGKGQFCDTPEGTCPGPKQYGACKARPQACTQIFDPVCGCDGKTYSNACMANVAGTSVAHHGECEKPGICANNADCASGSYCQKAEGQCRAPGLCAVRPQICPQIFKPVCGCDGKTYSNSCVAAAAGASVSSQGECPSKVFCGGIAGIPCPGAGTCVDDPSDDCDPAHGGADCGGMCVCAQTQLCVIGSHFDSSPKVCACVPDGGGACGPALCAPGTTCCNASCGICTPPGQACIQIACEVK